MLDGPHEVGANELHGSGRLVHGFLGVRPLLVLVDVADVAVSKGAGEVHSVVVHFAEQLHALGFHVAKPPVPQASGSLRRKGHGERWCLMCAASRRQFDLERK